MAIITRTKTDKVEKKLTSEEILQLKNTEKKIIAKLVSGSLGGGLSPEKNQLVMENFPLAIYMAKKYVRKDVDIQDLVQVAAIGLIKAVKKYNPSRKTKLSYYAIPTIDGELKHYIRDNCYSIRVSRKCVELNARIQKFREDFLYTNGREVTRTEIAKKFKLKLKTLDKIIQTVNAHYLTSLDAPVGSTGHKDSFIRLEEIVGGGCFTEDILEREGLVEALRALNLRDQMIIKYHFVSERSQADIAKRFNITQAQVSRVIRNSCQKIALALA
ncbi:RNA polymerase sigma factor SigB [Candidatus Termititenax persephonae]|uniref:RNA polymerase sigma factor SigB n=1 Tax=Candidatus Termititenax persephonae TaxID=2218525 RepID=A0A388TGK7_9BACT|nr:RNA polymerase sigma factor SigB [Candidatus Termititenax persephonae]